MEYVVVGFMCLVIGYGIGIAHHVRQLESEIKLRHEWESMAKGLVQAAAEYDRVAKNNTQQAQPESVTLRKCCDCGVTCNQRSTGTCYYKLEA